MARKRGHAGCDPAPVPTSVESRAGAVLPSGRCADVALTRLIPSGREFSKLVEPPGKPSTWVSITTELGGNPASRSAGMLKLGTSV